MNTEIKPNSWMDYILTFLLLIVFFGGGLLAWGYISRAPDKLVVEEPAPSDYPDYEQTKSLNKEVIVSDFSSWTPNSEIKPENVNTTLLVENGNVVKGYIYVRASLNNKALSQWESVYLKLNNVIGGHLFRPYSLAVPAGEKTELLYPLNSLPYLLSTPYNERYMPKQSNLLSLFKDGAEITITTFISSLRKAKIEELSLYYQCQEEDEECSVVVKQP